MTPEEKIIDLEVRVGKLESEVEALRKLVKTESSVIEPASIVAKEKEDVVTEPVKTVASSYSGGKSYTARFMNSQAGGTANTSTVSQRVVPDAQANTKTQSMENKIGKNVMGLVASALIFLGLFILGLAVYDILSDTIKIVIMFAISFALAAFGLLRMNKPGAPKTFYTGLAGCGMGAIYISIVLTHYIFDAISIGVLIGLLFVWTIFTAVLSRIRSTMFTYICYVGLTITTLLCANQWEEWPVSVIFYGIGIGVLFAFNFKKEYNENAFFFIQLPIMAVVLSLLYSESLIICSVIMLVPTVALILQNLLFEFKEKNNKILIPVTVLSFISMLVSMGIMYNLIDNIIIKYIFAALFVVITVLYYFVHRVEGETNIPFMFAFYMTAVILLVICLDWLWVIAIALLVFGIVKDDEHYRYTGYAYLLICLSCAKDVIPSSLLDDRCLSVYGIVFVVVIATIVAMRKKGYMIDKYIQAALIVLIPSALFKEKIIDISICLLLLGIISIICNTDIFRKNSVTGDIEKPSLIIGYVFNGLVLATLLINIAVHHGDLVIYNTIYGTEWVVSLILIVMGVAVCFINNMKLFELEVSDMAVGIYLCAKFTLLIFVVLERFDVNEFVISFIGIIIAVLCIVFGFVRKRKPFRMYGLVLSLICVAKLILADINYSTSIMWPIGFMGAGVLCFGISWLYSRLEKKEEEEEKDECRNM